MSSPAAVSTPTAMPSDSNRKYRSLGLLCFFFLVFKVFSTGADFPLDWHVFVFRFMIMCIPVYLSFFHMLH